MNDNGINVFYHGVFYYLIVEISNFVRIET